MANNYTQTAFTFECGTSENAARVASWINGDCQFPYPDDLRKAILAIDADAFEKGDHGILYKDELSNTIADATTSFGAVMISIEEGGELELLGVILQYAMNTMPDMPNGQGFTFAETCSQMRVGEFSGGACFIARGNVEPEWLFPHLWLSERQDEVRSTTPCRHRDDGRGRCIDCGAFI